MVLLASFGAICLIALAAALLTAIWTGAARAERERQRSRETLRVLNDDMRKGGAK
jgi:hypothetical protein